MLLRNNKLLNLLFLILLFSCSSTSILTCNYLKQTGCDVDSKCAYYSSNKPPKCFPVKNENLPIVAFPFEGSVPASCDQGVMSEDRATHAYVNAMFALDLYSKRDHAKTKILAGWAGKVVAFNECNTKNDGCGLGFGNQVKIFTPDGHILFYAHLENVFVKTGDVVKAGDVIGMEGETGAAGPNNRHLHFSVHYDWRELGYESWTKAGWLPLAVPFKINIPSYGNVDCRDIQCVRNRFNDLIKD